MKNQQSPWFPIETAPKDGTVFLARITKHWIETMFYDEGQLYYGSDGDSHPSGRKLPKYWMPLPYFPDNEEV